MSYDALVLHSGGMDSSLCLLLAVRKYGSDRVISLGVQYHQRHESELAAAKTIAEYYKVRRELIDIPPLPGWDNSSLITHSLSIQTTSGGPPNSFVVGRNGLFLMMAAPFARSVGAHSIFTGVMEREGANSGYPDCNRHYIDCVQSVIRIDLQDPSFSIQTPLIEMSKAEAMELADSLGELDFLLHHTVTCYNGLSGFGCRKCPSCKLRNEGIDEFYKSHPAKQRPVF
jgi:7-cyano-7-deazaguanine synthase